VPVGEGTGIVMHVQKPLPALPGSAVRSKEVDSKFEDAAFLPASCVAGAPDSLLLDAVEEYRRAAGNLEERVSGGASFRIDRNSFSLSEPKRTRARVDCGTHWVRTLGASRFLSFALAVDFRSPIEAGEYADQFNGERGADAHASASAVSSRRGRQALLSRARVEGD